jgi:hypothetical protein
MSTFIVAVAVLWSAVLVYLLTHRGAGLAGLALVAPVLGWWVIRQHGNGLLLAVGVLLTIPYWSAHVWLAAPLVATLGLVSGKSRIRLRVVDIAFVMLVSVFTMSWFFNPQLDIPVRAFVEGMLPFGYYIWSRFTLNERFLSRLQWTVFLAAAVGASTVLYEAVRGVSVFVDPQRYQWAGSVSAVFRAGGIFGGSPTAATVLAIIALSSAGLYRARPRLFLCVLAVILAAVVVTFDRAGIAAGLAGGTVLALLVPYRHWGRVAMVALALSIPVYAVTTSNSTLGRLGANKFVASGIVRSNTVADRQGLFADAAPLLDDSTSHLLFGRGFDALQALGRTDSNLAGSTFLRSQNGPNDDYLRAALEQGLLGLVLSLMWLGGSVMLGIRYCLRLPRGSDRRILVAGLTSAVLGYMVASLAHDFAHNVADLSVSALLAGVLVGVCSMPSEGRGDRTDHGGDLSPANIVET